MYPFPGGYFPQKGFQEAEAKVQEAEAKTFAAGDEKHQGPNQKTSGLGWVFP